MHVQVRETANAQPWAALRVVGCAARDDCSFPPELADCLFQVVRTSQSSLAARKINYFEMLVVCCRPQLDKLFPEFFDHYRRGEDFAGSQVIIILCADTRKSGKRGKGYVTAHAAAARECLTESASRAGLQADWTSLFDEDQIRSAFSIPDWSRIVKILSLRCPQDKPVRCPQCQNLEIPVKAFREIDLDK